MPIFFNIVYLHTFKINCLYASYSFTTLWVMRIKTVADIYPRSQSVVSWVHQVVVYSNCHQRNRGHLVYLAPNHVAHPKPVVNAVFAPAALGMGRLHERALVDRSVWNDRSVVRAFRIKAGIEGRFPLPAVTISRHDL